MPIEVKTAIVMSLIVLFFYITIAIVAPIHPHYRGSRRLDLVKISLKNSFWPILVGNIGIIAGAPRVRDFIRPFDAPFGVAMLGLFLGLLLWFLRERRRVLYGQIEMGFSILSLVWIGFNSHSIGIFQSSIAFFGAVYVFVRGLTNITDAEKASLAKSSVDTNNK